MIRCRRNLYGGWWPEVTSQLIHIIQLTMIRISFRWKMVIFGVMSATFVCVFLLPVHLRDMTSSLFFTYNEHHVSQIALANTSHTSSGQRRQSVIMPRDMDIDDKIQRTSVVTSDGPLNIFSQKHLKRTAMNDSEESVSRRHDREVAVITSLTDGKGLAKRLPDCVMVGVPKGGTYTLIHFLGFHPQMATPRDEVNFFHVDENFSQGYQWYLDRLPYSRPGQITMEKSPRYFYYEQVPKRIWNMNSNVKLLVILRDPIERVLSCHAHRVAKYKQDQVKYDLKPEDVVINPTTGKVNKKETCIDTSLYAKHLPRWLNQFPRDHIHLVDGDRLITDPYSEISKIEEYLGLTKWFQPDMFHFSKTKGFYCMVKPGGTREYCMPKSKGRKHPVISDKFYKEMVKFFRPYNTMLYSLTKRRFTWFAKYDIQY